jgi:hypothetical protein
MLSTDQLAGITGCSVVDRDGTTCGTAGTVYVDDRTDRVAWITVMLPMREEEMLAPADRAELRDGVLHLDCSLDELSRAPSMHGFEAIDRADETRLLEHYGMVGPVTDAPGAIAQSPTTGPGASGDLPTTMPSSSPVAGTGPEDLAGTTGYDLPSREGYLGPREGYLGPEGMTGRDRMGADVHHETFDSRPHDVEEPHLRRYQAPLG